MTRYLHSSGRYYSRSQFRYRVKCTKCKWHGTRRSQGHLPCPRCMSSVEVLGQVKERQP